MKVSRFIAAGAANSGRRDFAIVANKKCCTPLDVWRVFQANGNALLARFDAGDCSVQVHWSATISTVLELAEKEG